MIPSYVSGMNGQALDYALWSRVKLSERSKLEERLQIGDFSKLKNSSQILHFAFSILQFFTIPNSRLLS